MPLKQLIQMFQMPTQLFQIRESQEIEHCTKTKQA